MTADRRFERPRHLWRRLLLEVLLAVTWPVALFLVMFLPLTLPALVLLAEVERWRARECGEDVDVLHDSGDLLGWMWRRLRSPAWWRRDGPVALVGLLLTTLSALVLMVGGMAGVILLAAPAFYYVGTAVTAGPWTGDSLTASWLMVPVGVVVLAVSVVLLVLASLARDASVRGLGGHEAERLSAELGTVRTSRTSILEAFEAERRRIERDLHDGAQQDLVALSITLGMLEHAAASAEGEQAQRLRTLAARAHEQSERALVRLRETVHGIHPRELSDLGFFAALGTLTGRSPLRVDLRCSGDDERVPAALADALYFVVAEALTNVSKHAGVEMAQVSASVDAGKVQVSVRDDGRGGADLARPGTGLSGLRERLRALDGDLAVASPTGDGTTVTATAPLRAERESRGSVQA